MLHSTMKCIYICNTNNKAKRIVAFQKLLGCDNHKTQSLKKEFRKELFAESKQEIKSKMKTKNNVQKTGLRFAAVVVSFILLSYTVNAQDFWKRFLENSSFGHIAMVMAATETTSPDASLNDSDAVVEHFEAEAENRLELEGWMLNEFNFIRPALNFEEASDDALRVEPWMLNQELFQTATETELPLELEDWMVSGTVWEI